MAAAEGVAKLLYIVVLEDDAAAGEEKSGPPSFRYTRSVLQSTLQLMGCKARHAFKVYRAFCLEVVQFFSGFFLGSVQLLLAVHACPSRF